MWHFKVGRTQPGRHICLHRQALICKPVSVHRHSPNGCQQTGIGRTSAQGGIRGWSCVVHDDCTELCATYARKVCSDDSRGAPELRAKSGQENCPAVTLSDATEQHVKSGPESCSAVVLSDVPELVADVLHRALLARCCTERCAKCNGFRPVLGELVFQTCCAVSKMIFCTGAQQLQV